MMDREDIREIVTDIISNDLKVMGGGDVTVSKTGLSILVSSFTQPTRRTFEEPPAAAEEAVYHPLQISLFQDGATWKYWVYLGTAFNRIPLIGVTPITTDNSVATIFSADRDVYLRLNKDTALTGPPVYVDPYEGDVSSVEIVDQPLAPTWDPENGVDGFTQTTPTNPGDDSVQHIHLGRILWNAGAPTVSNTLTGSIAGARNGGPGSHYLYWPAS